MNKYIRQKSILSVALAVAVTVSAFAQGNGLAGITEATTMVSSYFEPATKLIYAVGAVIGLIGGVKVYSKFSSGDPDTSKTAASWFGACIFLIVAATILRSFFL
jgi:conjugative transposon protein traE